MRDHLEAPDNFPDTGGAQTSGRQRLNIHGALDLETGKTRMMEVATVNAASTIMLLMAIEAADGSAKAVLGE